MLRKGIIAVIFSLLFCAKNTPALAHSADGSTTVLLSANPTQLVQGDDVVVSTHTISMASGFSDAHPEMIDSGTVVIELAVDALGKPTASSSAAAWLPLNPGTHPIGGNASISLDLDQWGFIPGAVGGLRAKYLSCDGTDSVKTHYSPSVDMVAAEAPCDGTGLEIAADFVSGNGTPNPNFSTLDTNNPFIFGLKVRNCTGADLASVKVTGSTTGWTELREIAVTEGQYEIRGASKGKAVIWTVDIPRNGEVTLSILLDAMIPMDEKCRCEDGGSDDTEEYIRYLTGFWSAVYDAGSGQKKARYHGRVSVTVTCP